MYMLYSVSVVTYTDQIKEMMIEQLLSAPKKHQKTTDQKQITLLGMCVMVKYGND